MLKYLGFFLLAVAMVGQTDTGELRVTVADSMGLPVPAMVELSSEVNHYRESLDADAEGHVTFKRLPYGLYRAELHREGFAAYSSLIEIRSAIPRELGVVLSPASIQTSVTVSDDATLIDPHRTDTVNRIGGDTLEDRLASPPGRSLAALVNQQPGWVFEANGILHPRGEEYQTQYVMDGIPLTDNRSAAFVADLDADNVQEMSVMTAGFPAEYGRKLGGVIEVQTARDTRQGFHGKIVASGGSFDTANGYAEGKYGWGLNTLTLSLTGATTDRFLDPPATQNYTNHGANADLMGHYERDIDGKNRIGIIVRREQSKFQVPDEILQAQGGQRQDRRSFESAAQLSYTHIFSADVLGDFRAMIRDITAGLWSNDLSTPMIVSQDRRYREGYVKGAISVHHGVHEFKAGAEGDFAGLQESLSYLITDPTQFDPGTPLSFQYFGHAPDREQGAFAQDMIRLKNWTLSGGLRFDHYGLLVNQSAWSPRAGVAYHVPKADVVFRASYDRIFQTPAFENLLVSSSSAVTSLSDQVLRLPVQPARGNYYEAGFAKALFGKLRLDANFYRREYTNYPDDDLLLNTGVGFPITFSKATIQGAEAKLEIPRWGPFSGYVSWSNMHGNGYFPVTGGLFLGDDAAQAVSATGGAFPVTQDQRNTVRARYRYQITPRLWAAIGGTYDSGLPVDFTGTYADATAAYSQNILNRVNFSDYRARPGFTLNLSAGVLLRKREKGSLRFQADVLNATNQLNVIDFAGLFSGTALAAPRSVDGRLQFDF